MKKHLMIILVLCCAINLIAQKHLELKSWTGISYETKFKIKKQKFKLGIDQQVRISDLVYNTRVSALTQVEVSKKITDFYKIGLSYRLSYINRLRNRLSLNNSFKVEKDILSVNFRLRYQAEFEKNNPFAQEVRLKTTFKFEANKDYRPYFFGEIFYLNTSGFSNINEYRAGIGLDADYKKKHQFNFMLMYSQELNMERPGKSLVLGLFYTFAK